MKEKQDITVGSAVWFGFYGEEILRWLVLDVRDGHALIVTEFGVCTSAYHDQAGPVAWYQSALRGWLNTTFCESAFTDRERGAILDMQFPEHSDPDRTLDPEAFDRVFLLSREEAERYFPSDEDRALTFVDRSEPGLWIQFDGFRETCCWWLRGNSVESEGRHYVHVCGMDGTLGAMLQSTGMPAAVRPAMWVEAEALRPAPEAPARKPLLGLLKRTPDATVTGFRGWPHEREVLGSFVDFALGCEYLLLKPEPSDLLHPDADMARLETDFDIGSRAARKRDELVRLLREKPFGQVADMLRKQLYEYRVSKSMGQPAWRSSAANVPAAPAEGDELIFGRNPFDRDEPLRWLVLARKGGRALLICQKGLCYDRFADESRFDFEDVNRWEASELREWLNTDFCGRAFTPPEWRALVPYRTDPGDRLGRFEAADAPVLDRCFLLSDAEAAVWFPDDESRRLGPTPDAKDLLFFRQKDSDPGCVWWWTRSRGAKVGNVACVNPSGRVDPEGCEAIGNLCAVRPAILVDLRKLAKSRD